MIVDRHAGKHATHPLTCQIGAGIFMAETGDFQTTLEEMKKAYDCLRGDYSTGVFNAVSEAIAIGLQSAKGICPPPQRPVFDLSNPGRVEDFLQPFYGPIEIKRVNLTCRDLFGMLMIVVTSFRGRLRGSLGFNHRYHYQEEVETLVRLFKEVLLASLGIEQDCDAIEVPL